MKEIKWIPEAIQLKEDEETGAVIEQLTSEPVTSNNIYCEQRFASQDGSRIAITRKPFGRNTEIWICDFSSLRLCKAAIGNPIAANPFKNSIYYINKVKDKNALMRLDLLTLKTEEVFIFEKIPLSMGIQKGAITYDEKSFVYGPFPVHKNIFALYRLNLPNGTEETICEIEDMFNPHLQVSIDNKYCIIQINRGGTFDKKTGKISLTGEIGATLALLNLQNNKVIPLPAGRPHTPPISGHECWAGNTNKILFTAGQYHVTKSSFVTLVKPPPEETHMPLAAIYSVAPKDKAPTILSIGLLFNHISASLDGEFFVADDHNTSEIYIGSIKTGRYLRLCNSYTRQGACQTSHVHPYLTPDNKFVVFNSIATGVPQVYRASVPEDFLKKIQKGNNK